MRQFYETYASDKKVSPLVTQSHPSALSILKEGEGILQRFCF